MQTLGHDFHSYPGLAQALLPRTVLHAARRTEFYREHYRAVDLSRWVAAPCLHDLPFVDKEIIRAAGGAAADQSLLCAAIQNTSGTTGEMLFLRRSYEEFQFINDFYSEFLSRKEVVNKPILLALTVPSHGSPTPVPTNAFVLVGSVTSESGAARTARYLTNTYDVPGTSGSVSGLSGGLWQIAALTGYLRSRNIPKPTSVSVVSTTGDYLSTNLRSWLNSYWGENAVSNRYSLSEFFGGASECAACGAFHFDAFLIPELVSLDDGAVISEGVGRLALTALHPFVQMQPLIRYLTDDLFELRETNCAVPSFFYCGRVGHSLVKRVNGQARLLLSARMVYEAVDACVGVFRDDQTFGLAVGTPGAGKPRIAALTGESAGRLALKLIVAYSGKKSDQNHRAKEIRRTMLALSPALAIGVADKTISFEVEFARPELVASGTLSRQGRLW